MVGKLARESVIRNKIKLNISKKMHDIRRDLCVKYGEPTYTESEDESSDHEKKKVSIFNTQINEESMAMIKIKRDFLDNIKHNEQFKKVEIEHIGKGEMEKNNPRIKLFTQSKKDGELDIHLLEKLHN